MLLRRSSFFSISPLLLAVPLLLGGCGAPDSPQQLEREPASQITSPDVMSNDHHYFHEVERSHSAEWSYEGQTGPDHWGDLTPQYVLAKNGRRQSPINIGDTQSTQLPPLSFDYHPAKIVLVYNGHTIKETEERGSLLHVGATTFELKQFHFHSPSEHTVNGEHFDMEVHLVHRSEAGQIAVVGVFIHQGQANLALDAIWNYLPTETNKQLEYESVFNAVSLLPASRQYVAYDGSLTTPPCTEGVKWFVLTNPIELSKAQIEKFRRIISGNNRPVQKLYGRRVLRHAD